MLKWQINSPEVQAAAIIAAIEHMKRFDPEQSGEWHQKDVGHYRSMWFQAVRSRAEDMLRELDQDKVQR